MFDSNPVYHVYYNLNVTAGQTVYFRWSGINDASVTLTFKTENTLDITGQDPEANSTVMCTKTSQLSFGFNNVVSCSKVEIIAGSVTKPIDFGVNGNSVFFEVKEPIYTMMAAGQLHEGDEFTIRLSGLCVEGDEDVKYGTDGVYTSTFKCGAKPVALVSKSNFSNDHQFRSFWPKGDAEGIVTLTFDGNIKLAADKVTLTYADNSSGAEASAKYVEVPPYTVAGNKLTIDLTDKERTPQGMLGISTVYETMKLTVSNVCDEQGNPVYTNTNGSRGSYAVSMPYSVETVEANTEITPASGSVLGDAKQIEIFATDYKKFSFSGVKFVYTDANNATKVATVAKDACTETADSDIAGAYTLTIPVPAEVTGQKDIFMSLTDLQAADGKDYSALFSAKYNGFAVLDMTYQASTEAAPITLKGAQLAELVTDAPIVISTNRDGVTGNDSISYVTYDVTDLNPAEGDEAAIVTPTHIENYVAGSGWEGEGVGSANTKLYLGHTYRVVVTGYQQIAKFFNPYRDIKVGTDTLYFTGTQPDYVYSDVKLEGFTPADSAIVSADDFTITATYDGLVKIVEAETGAINGYNGLKKFSSYTPVNPDSEGYASQWTLSMTEEDANKFEDRSVIVQIAAEDQDGNRVRGNVGLREATLRSINFTLEYNGADLTVATTQGGTEDLDSLYQFDVTTPDVISLGALALSEAHVFDMLNTVDVPVVAAKFIFEDPTVQEINDYIESNSYEEAEAKYGAEATQNAYLESTNTVRLTLEHAITEEGGYTLYIPAGYFNSGEQFEGVVSKTYEGFFTVKGQEEPVSANFTTDPANGSTVSSLSTISITYDDLEEIGTGSGIITVKKDGEVIEKLDAELDWDVYNKANITLSSEQTEQGIYTIEIPEGYFVTAEGDDLPAVTLEYGIGIATGINTAKTNVEADATYTLGGVRVSGKLPAGLYIKGGKKVVIK